MNTENVENVSRTSQRSQRISAGQSSDSTSPKLSVIITIPALNEEECLARVIGDIAKVMGKTPYAWKVLVVDDGSTDKTIEVGRKAGAVVVSHGRNRGLAEAFKTEMRECLRLGADIIVHTDADGQYDPASIPHLIKKVEEGHDLVLGSRFLGSSMGHMPFTKRIGNKAFNRVFTHLLGQRITDSTTGFRAFTSEVARDIHFINTFTYTQEQLIRAKRQKFRIAEIPIKSFPTRESRLFKGPIQYAVKAWINIFRIYRNYEPLQFFGKIGLTFFSIGALLGVWLVYRFIALGNVGRLPTTILSALFMLVGIQIILFGFLADMINNRKV